MGSYSTVTITGPVTLAQVEALAEQHSLADILGQLDVDERDGEIVVSGSSKWTPELGAFAAEVSEPEGVIATWHHEWDNRDADESGEETFVYHHGEHHSDEGAESGQLPRNLEALLAAVECALAEGGDALPAASRELVVAVRRWQ
ncbi:hypothetical protein [Agromyces bauzanensis]